MSAGEIHARMARPATPPVHLSLCREPRKREMAPECGAHDATGLCASATIGDGRLNEALHTAQMTLRCDHHHPHVRAWRDASSLENDMADTTAQRTIYSIQWLYRLDTAFHGLPASSQRAAKESFLRALEGRDKGV